MRRRSGGKLSYDSGLVSANHGRLFGAPTEAPVADAEVDRLVRMASPPSKQRRPTSARPLSARTPRRFRPQSATNARRADAVTKALQMLNGYGVRSPQAEVSSGFERLRSTAPPLHNLLSEHNGWPPPATYAAPEEPKRAPVVPPLNDAPVDPIEFPRVEPPSPAAKEPLPTPSSLSGDDLQEWLRALRDERPLFASTSLYSEYAMAQAKAVAGDVAPHAAPTAVALDVVATTLSECLPKATQQVVMASLEAAVYTSPPTGDGARTTHADAVSALEADNAALRAQVARLQQAAEEAKQASYDGSYSWQPAETWPPRGSSPPGGPDASPHAQSLPAPRAVPPVRTRWLLNTFATAVLAVRAYKKHKVAVLLSTDDSPKHRSSMAPSPLYAKPSPLHSSIRAKSLSPAVSFMHAGGAPSSPPLLDTPPVGGSPAPEPTDPSAMATAVDAIQGAFAKLAEKPGLQEEALHRVLDQVPSLRHVVNAPALGHLLACAAPADIDALAMMASLQRPSDVEEAVAKELDFRASVCARIDVGMQRSAKKTSRPGSAASGTGLWRSKFRPQALDLGPASASASPTPSPPSTHRSLLRSPSTANLAATAASADMARIRQTFGLDHTLSPGLSSADSSRESSPRATASPRMFFGVMSLSPQSTPLPGKPVPHLRLSGTNTWRGGGGGGTSGGEDPPSTAEPSTQQLMTKVFVDTKWRAEHTEGDSSHDAVLAKVDAVLEALRAAHATMDSVRDDAAAKVREALQVAAKSAACTRCHSLHEDLMCTSCAEDAGRHHALSLMEDAEDVGVATPKQPPPPVARARSRRLGLVRAPSRRRRKLSTAGVGPQRALHGLPALLVSGSLVSAQKKRILLQDGEFKALLGRQAALLPSLRDTEALVATLSAHRVAAGDVTVDLAAFCLQWFVAQEASMSKAARRLLMLHCALKKHAQASGRCRLFAELLSSSPSALLSLPVATAAYVHAVALVLPAVVAAGGQTNVTTVHDAVVHALTPPVLTIDEDTLATAMPPLLRRVLGTQAAVTEALARVHAVHADYVTVDMLLGSVMDVWGITQQKYIDAVEAAFEAAVATAKATTMGRMDFDTFVGLLRQVVPRVGDLDAFRLFGACVGGDDTAALPPFLAGILDLQKTALTALYRGIVIACSDDADGAVEELLLELQRWTVVPPTP